jgi:hypothetical protein
MKINRFINLMAIAFGLAAFPAATFSAIDAVPEQAAAPPVFQGNDLFSFAQEADPHPSDSAYLSLFVLGHKCISTDLDQADSFCLQPVVGPAGSCVESGGSGGGEISVVTSIPEPSTYAMLAGLGAFGLVAWRKRSPAGGDSAIIR